MTARIELEKAHSAMKDGRLDEAIAVCDAVIADEPNLAKAHQLRSLIAIKGQDLSAAEYHIKAALALTPNDPECLNTYGNILKTTGRNPEAVTAYQQSLKAAPNYLPAAQHLGELYLINKDPIEAAGVFQSALRYYEAHPMLTRGLLYALKDSGQNDAAKNLLAQIPPAPDLAITAGQIFAQGGQTSAAQAAFTQALAHPPSAVLAFRNLLNIAWMRDGIDAARETIDKMVVASPEVGFVYVEGADLLMDMGEPAAGLSLLDQCEAKFGKQPDIDHARARILIEQGDGKAAFDLAAKALAARQDDLGFVSTYARAALMTEQFKQALSAARHSQARQPNNQFWTAIEASALRGLGQDRSKDYKRLYDYARLVKAYDLEAPPEYNDLEDFLTQLKSALTERHNNTNHPAGQSLRFGTQTSSDLRFADSRVIQDFFQALARPITDYMAQVGTGADHPLTLRNTGNYRLTGAWSVQLGAGGFHVNHVHPEGWISSAFYVDVPEGTDEDSDKKGWIKFGEAPFEIPGQSYEHIIAPKAGRLVLFPSYMWHGTIPIADGASRMTLPFDAVPV